MKLLMLATTNFAMRLKATNERTNSKQQMHATIKHNELEMEAKATGNMQQQLTPPP